MISTPAAKKSLSYGLGYHGQLPAQPVQAKQSAPFMSFEAQLLHWDDVSF
jgi:hypothetical protein